MPDFVADPHTLSAFFRFKEVFNGKNKEHSNHSHRSDRTRTCQKDWKTTYMVGIHFSQTSKETMDDKVLRLIKNDIRNAAMCG